MASQPIAPTGLGSIHGIFRPSPEPLPEGELSRAQQKDDKNAVWNQTIRESAYLAGSEVEVYDSIFMKAAWGSFMSPRKTVSGSIDIVSKAILDRGMTVVGEAFSEEQKFGREEIPGVTYTADGKRKIKFDDLDIAKFLKSEVKDVFGKALNIVSLGEAETVADIYQKSKDDLGNIKLGELTSEVIQEVIGWDTITELKSGRNPVTHEQLTPEEFGARVLGVGLMAVPTIHGVGAVTNAIRKGVKHVKAPAPLTKGQIDAKAASLADGISESDLVAKVDGWIEEPKIKEAFEKIQEVVPNVQVMDLARAMIARGNDVDATLNMLQDGMRPAETHSAIRATHEWIRKMADEDPVKLQENMLVAAADAMIKDAPQTRTQFFASMLRTGAFDPESLAGSMRSLYVNHNYTPAELGRIHVGFANAMETSVKSGALHMNAIRHSFNKAFDEAFAEYPELAQSIKRAAGDMGDDAKSWQTLNQKVGDIYRNVLRYRRASLTSQPITTARNVKVSGLLYGLDFLFEDLGTDLIHAMPAMVGKYTNRTHTDKATVGAHMYNTYTSIATVFAGVNASITRGKAAFQKFGLNDPQVFAARSKLMTQAEADGRGISVEDLGTRRARVEELESKFKPQGRGAQTLSALGLESTRITAEKVAGKLTREDMYIPQGIWDFRKKTLERVWAIYENGKEAFDPAYTAILDSNVADMNVRNALDPTYWTNKRANAGMTEQASTFRNNLKTFSGLGWREKLSTGADVLSIMNRTQEMAMRKLHFTRVMFREANEFGYRGLDGVERYIDEARNNPKGLPDRLIGPLASRGEAIAKLTEMDNRIPQITDKIIAASAAHGPLLTVKKGIERAKRKSRRDARKESTFEELLEPELRVKKGLSPEKELEFLQRSLNTRLRTSVRGALDQLVASKTINAKRWNEKRGAYEIKKEQVHAQNAEALKAKLEKEGWEGVNGDDPIKIEEVNWQDTVASLPDALVKELGSSKKNAAVAFAEATDGAMSGTLARTPREGGFASALLGVYQKVPFLADLGFMFPRFLANQYMWLWERNPFQLIDALGGETMAGLFAKSVKDPEFRVPNAIAKRVARGAEGMMIYSAAGLLRSSNFAGPKYYQVNTGTEDEFGNPVYIDTRPDEPLNTFMWLHQAYKEATSPVEVEHKMTDDEWIGGLVGTRRLTDIPILNIPYIAQAIERGDRQSVNQAFLQLAGDIGRSFLVPFKGINDFVGGMAQVAAENIPEDNMITRALKGSAEALADHTLAVINTMEDEFFGSMIGDILGLRAVFNNRVNPFTGEYMKTRGPLKRMVGISTRSITPWEEMLSSVNMGPFDMIGSWESRSAVIGISEGTGKILRTRQPDGRTYEETIVAKINEMSKGHPIEFKKELVSQYNEAIRGGATKRALDGGRYTAVIQRELEYKEAESLVKQNVKKKLFGK
jgi:hypothetical protein